MRYQVRNSGHWNWRAAKLLWEKPLSTIRLAELDGLLYSRRSNTTPANVFTSIGAYLFHLLWFLWYIRKSRREKKKFDRSQRRKWQNWSARIYFYAWNRPIPLRERKLACAFGVTQVMSRRGADRGIQTRRTILHFLVWCLSPIWRIQILPRVKLYHAKGTEILF